jgi:AraC-like DNA-binding protein
MRAQRLYADCTLTLAGLAARFDLPEYRLRQTIHRELGFRNVNAFLNHLRLDEAASRLADPAQARLPILTIALDVGFGSIGPFNRSFKERYGLTPSEFRQRPEAARDEFPVTSGVAGQN